MKCAYKKPQPCQGNLADPYEKPPGRWWAVCLLCGRTNRLTVNATIDGGKVSHASPVGPPSDDLVPFSARINRSQADWLKSQINGQEIVRLALDKYMNAVVEL